MQIDAIKAAIRDVPDFPQPGILFKDITPVIADAALFRACVDIFAERHAKNNIETVAAVDARGFLFAGALCERLDCGLVPIRKQGKLPYHTHERSYDLEYGTATLTIHKDAFPNGERVLLIDDLLATGGTARAAVDLVEAAGGTLVEADFLVELAFLNGRSKLDGVPVYAPVVY
jgi:adenine phosphoribosyltransferase